MRTQRSADGRQENRLAIGTEVCVEVVAGVRYALEDALREHGLEPADSCATADVQAQETGQDGDFSLAYRRIGDAEWKKCASKAATRSEFLDQCLEHMRNALGGGMGVTALTGRD